MVAIACFNTFTCVSLNVYVRERVLAHFRVCLRVRVSVCLCVYMYMYVCLCSFVLYTDIAIVLYFLICIYT